MVTLRWGPFRKIGLGVLLAVLWTSPAAAQAVAGRLADPADAAVAEAIVSLVDSAGQEVARTATSASGRFRLAAREPGSYRVRVFRIGHSPWESDPVTLAAGATTTLDAEIPALPVQLPELVAVAPGRCEGAAEGSAAALLLEEARKALGLAREASRRGTTFEVATFDITLDRDLRVREERQSRGTSSRDLPIVSTSVDTLRRFGFVRQVPAYDPNGPVYYGPDDRVLLSDWFLTTHCFTVAARSDSLIEVEFTPADRGGRPDIEGTMRFDADSLVLRSLRFAYVRLPRWVPDGSAGGAVAFERIPGVGLVATQWWLRAPIAEIPMGQGSTRLHGFREAGGVVVGIAGRGGRATADPRDARTPLAAIGTRRGSGGGADAPELLTEEIAGGAGRRILALNPGAVPVTIEELEVRNCTNVAGACGRHRLVRTIAPGETVHLLIVRPRDAERDYRFTAAFEWRE